MALDAEILADQIRRAFWGESWHGPSVREVLTGVSAEDAAAHPAFCWRRRCGSEAAAVEQGDEADEAFGGTVTR